MDSKPGPDQLCQQQGPRVPMGCPAHLPPLPGGSPTTSARSSSCTRRWSSRSASRGSSCRLRWAPQRAPCPGLLAGLLRGQWRPVWGQAVAGSGSSHAPDQGGGVGSAEPLPLSAGFHCVPWSQSFCSRGLGSLVATIQARAKEVLQRRLWLGSCPPGPGEVKCGEGRAGPQGLRPLCSPE